MTLKTNRELNVTLITTSANGSTTRKFEGMNDQVKRSTLVSTNNQPLAQNPKTELSLFVEIENSGFVSTGRTNLQKRNGDVVMNAERLSCTP